ncbi:HNH endonuclease signature motif containing protein [Agromyces lapidis]|uniref:HNH endonuclease signature motif containing protein n=1 Tax=Agromyces lapidis TaxID=279574 RepID=A0ABV5SMF7_9MICO|nr:HNH endonuclease signature motif containing protein [Agromyces lapidis]
MHYKRIRKTGHADSINDLSIEERFWSKTERDGDCIVWSAGRSDTGYGTVKLDGRTQLVHRVAYEWSGRTIPEGLVLDHLCRNRACVNVEHLEPVTQAENVARGVSPLARYITDVPQDLCSKGHKLTSENVYVHRRPGRQRPTLACKTCRRIRAAA